MEWISVEDRLPEPEYKQEQVIISCCEGIVIAGWYDKENRVFKDEHNGAWVPEVTHWMPLPEAPEV